MVVRRRRPLSWPQTYAPEGEATYARRPATDLRKVLAAVDGATISATIGYTINDQRDRCPAHRELGEQGGPPGSLAKLNGISTQCIGDSILGTAFPAHQRLDQIRQDAPASSSICTGGDRGSRENRIGKLKPGNAPVCLQGGLHDDVIPYGQVRDLYRNWTAQGCQVTFHTTALRRS